MDVNYQIMKKSEKEYLDKLSQFGCVVCKKFYGVYTPTSIHHIRTGMGLGQRNSTENCLPLCPNHHQHGGHGVAFHAGKKAFEQKYGTELELLEWLKERL
jgi:hypothetical protein